MTENEFLLSDRIQKIKAIDEQWDLNKNSYIAFSGGKDSTILHYLIDMALPNNTIPRVYANTGIELKMIRQFVEKFASVDNRFMIIKPSKNIRNILEEKGYPFKSKLHANQVDYYQKKGMYQRIHNYLGDEHKNKDLFRICPKKLQYQFTEKNTLRISDQCCIELKEKPMIEYAKKNKKTCAITGLLKEEGGRRTLANCVTITSNKLRTFKPLLVVTKDWEDWFIKEYNLEICDIYKPPYNFVRTGCKGCPFALNLQNELDTLKKFFPSEYKQCETIWKPVYDEYRRLHYRLSPKNMLGLYLL